LWGRLPGLAKTQITALFAAEMRARACVAYLSYEAAVLAKSAKKDRPKLLDKFFDLITQPEFAEGRGAHDC
jgi:predicted Zn-dependent peptidase